MNVMWARGRHLNASVHCRTPFGYLTLIVCCELPSFMDQYIGFVLYFFLQQFEFKLTILGYVLASIGQLFLFYIHLIKYIFGRFCLYFFPSHFLSLSLWLILLDKNLVTSMTATNLLETAKLDQIMSRPDISSLLPFSICSCSVNLIEHLQRKAQIRKLTAELKAISV